MKIKDVRTIGTKERAPSGFVVCAYCGFSYFNSDSADVVGISTIMRIINRYYKNCPRCMIVNDGTHESI